MADQISKTDPGTVSVGILSNSTFGATTIDPASISMGVGYKNAATWAKPISVALQDVNGDGKNDMVATFTIHDIVSSSKGGATVVNLQDLFLQGENNGTIFVAEGVVNIVP